MEQTSQPTVNLNAITQNIEVLKSYLNEGTQFMAVVKADAYGHGAVQVAQQITGDVVWLAVNSPDEGIELREHDISVPILVFGVPTEKEADLYGQYDLTATVSAVEHFSLLPAGTAYHLNFDTGMGRLGFRPEQAEQVQKLMASHPDLQATGLYSHFATADDLSSTKPKEQLRLFNEIRDHFKPEVTVHMSNTAGLGRFKDSQFSMVRSGIGVYGYAPGEVSIPGLEPAMKWETELVDVHAIKKGETVSYGATWQAPQAGFIGVIPVGYADGIPRGLSNKFEVTIGGKTYPSVGTVTMNYCMINLGADRLSPGMSVELWNAEHHAGTWAEACGTIPYELLTGVSRMKLRR